MTSSPSSPVPPLFTPGFASALTLAIPRFTINRPFSRPIASAAIGALDLDG